MTVPTGNVYLDSISWGGWHWLPTGGPVTLNVFFDDDYSVWTGGEKASYLAAFDAWASVTNMTVNVVTDEASAQFIAHTLSDAQMQILAGPGVFGFHETPDTAVDDGQVHGYFNYEGYSWPEQGWVYDEGGLAVGGWGFYTMMHELGHGLGFAHPHDTGGGSNLMPGVSSPGDYGTHDINQGVSTIMSYNAGLPQVQDAQGAGLADYGYNSGLGAFDIALAQFYYGADTDHNGGPTTYVLPETGGWISIWDTGGTDAIRYDGSGDVVINLNSARLDTSAAAAGFLSAVVDGGGNSYFGGFTIAGDFTNALADVGGETGVIIENAFGGTGNDTLIGNAVGNWMLGRTGDDDLSGNGGGDILFGGGGRDILSGGDGNDTLNGHASHDTLNGGDGEDNLRGGFGADLLIGGGGDNDRMFGDEGRDTFLFQAGFGRDIVMDFEDDLDTIKLDDNLWTGALTKQQVLDQFARDVGDHILLEFGNGDTLVLRNVADIADLFDDLVIF